MPYFHYEAAARKESHVSHSLERQPLARLARGSSIAWVAGTAEVVSVPLAAGRAEVIELARCLSGAERLRADHFVFERDRRRFIVGRAYLRHLLASQLGVEPEAVEFEYGPRGKPALSRRYAGTDLRFNVSHSEDVAVYAFSRGRELGIDVESVRLISDADEIAARCFSPREYESYRALDPRNRPLGFFNCWTRKEAFIKATGEGLHHPLDCFDVSLAPSEPARILRVGETPGPDCGWHLDSFSPALGFVAAIVTQSGSRLSVAARGVRTHIDLHSCPERGGQESPLPVRHRSRLGPGNRDDEVDS